MIDKKELERIKIISNKPILPIKQRNSIGHTYNKICSRSCYRINNLHQWVYCECIRIERKKTLLKQNLLLH